MANIQLGDLATWITGLATVGALWVAFQQIDQERKHRQRAEQREKRELLQKQASAVSAWIEGEHENSGHVALANNSAGSVYKVIVSVVGLQKGRRDPKAIPIDRYFLAMQPPGTRYLSRNQMSFQGLPSDLSLTVELAFIDGAGRTWIRYPSGELKQSRKPPIDFYGVPEPEEWVMPPADLRRKS